jgi:tRNA (cytidine/uridine-2'-O-)-methyltransferase
MQQRPANTGNIIRLSACLNIDLHLIHPLGFDFSDKHLKRAGLDYHDLTNITHYQNEEEFWGNMKNRRVISLSTKATQSLWSFEAREGDCFIFGPESRGLPPHMLEKSTMKIKIPMNPTTRSLNLSNSAAVLGYEAMRQLSIERN